MTSDSLLGHLAWRFPGATEDIATEALQYILSKQEGARTGLADLLKSGGADPEPMDCFDTQRVYQGTKKPDLVAFNKGKEVLLVESKFWAWLTSNQPNGYLKLMMDELPTARNLLFIAPDTRQDELWKELLELAGKEFEVADNPSADSVRSTTVGSDGHRLMLTSWDTLLDCLGCSRADEDGDLRQLRGLCAPASDDATLPCGEAEDLSVVDHYKTLLRDAVALAASQGIISTEGLSYGAPSAGYGRYIHFVNAAGEKFAPAYAWVGFNFTRTGAPFFLWFVAGSDAMEDIHKQMAGDLDQHDHVSIPIDATAGYAHVREEVVGRLKEVRDRITVSGVLESTHEPEQAG